MGNCSSIEDEELHNAVMARMTIDKSMELLKQKNYKNEKYINSKIAKYVELFDIYNNRSGSYKIKE